MMKKKLYLPIIAVIIFFFCGVAWWLSPVSLMKNINSKDITCIEVSGGNSGDIFSITNPDTITSIISNIQSISLKKSKISLMYSGALFNLSFKNYQGKTVYNLTVNDNTTIRKDPFFYYDITGSICFDLLNELEASAMIHN